MNQLNVLSVVGARPQFIKASGVSKAISERGDVAEKLIHTGQHFDYGMSDVFFLDLGIPPPTYHLGIGGLSHGAMTGRMIERLEHVMMREKPDVVLVYGDTNSTLAGALAAVKLNIPVAHVEAGLRSFNRSMPEEVNRILTDHASECLFAPSERAVTNLRHEGISDKWIYQTGDVMYDVALRYVDGSRADIRMLEALGLRRKEYVLATVHRAENTDDVTRLAAIMQGLSIVGERLPVVIPLHPRTKKVMQACAQIVSVGAGVQIVEPLSYTNMLLLEMHARVIATDSGGIQKEAYFFQTPCVTLRHETEWTELVDIGANRLAPPTSAEEVATAVLGAAKNGFPADAPKLYGDGTASTRIVGALVERYGSI